MISRVRLRYFKRFEAQEFDLGDHIVLAGPNNSGKTTLLQAIVAWDLARARWRERGRPRGTQRVAVPVTRKDFTAVPLAGMNQLWTNGSTAVRKAEKGRGNVGSPRLIEIDLSGLDSDGSPWSLRFEYRCQSREQVYVRPQEEYLNRLPKGAEELRLVHVPAFSGIGVTETRYDRPYQDLLIGQGRAGDILRNLLLDLQQQPAEWSALVNHIRDIFGFELTPPDYEGRPFIECEYVPRPGLGALDVASGGSGFHQVLLLLAFFYARPATVFLMDEPDAHQHVVLQKQVYDLLRRIASERACQLILATHSEVLIDGTSPDRIISFYGEPHILQDDIDRDQVREAIKRLPALDLLLAERSPGVLYVENETDFNLLRAWARVLRHAASDWFEKEPFWHANKGRHPREARGHFFAMRAIRKGYQGLLVLDGDNRGLPEREVMAEGLTLARWSRYEVESYLHPAAVIRWVRARWPLFAEKAEAYLADQLPPAALRDALADSAFWVGTPVSKTLWPGLFEACGLQVRKQDYYLIAEAMEPEEVHPEVVAKLDSIVTAFGLAGTQRS